MNEPFFANDHETKGHDEEGCKYNELDLLPNCLYAEGRWVHWILWVNGTLADHFGDVGDHDREAPAKRHLPWGRHEGGGITFVIGSH